MAAHFYGSWLVSRAVGTVIHECVLSVAGVQVWYGIHGARHAGLGPSPHLLAQHPPSHIHRVPQRAHCLTVPPHGPLLPRLCTQVGFQGRYILIISIKHSFLLEGTVLAAKVDRVFS